MKRVSTVVLWILSLVAVTACGGGASSDGGGVVTPSLSASFTPEEPNPGPDTVAMDEGPRTGDLVTLEVQVTDTNGVYGAAFDVAYDAGMATFDNWSAGSFLEQGGHASVYQINADQPGRLVVVATRQGAVAGADAVGSVTLIRLRFRVTETGTSPISLPGAPTLFDDQVQPQPISGIAWFGGVIVGT